RGRHTRFSRDWSADVCSSDLGLVGNAHEHHRGGEAFAVPGGAPGAGVAAVRATGDAHPVAIDESDIDEVVDAIDQVVELLHARRSEERRGGKRWSAESRPWHQ